MGRTASGSAKPWLLQAVAKTAGKKWGGSEKGRLHKTTVEQVRQIAAMKQAREKIARISRTVGIDRPGAYRVLRWVASGDIGV